MTNATVGTLTTTSEIVRAETFESALHPKTIGRAGAVDAVSWRLIYLDRGEAEIITDGQSFHLSAPCVTWHPWTTEHRLRIGAGTVGAHILFGFSAVANAIGHQPESSDLRFMVDRRGHLPLSGTPSIAETMSFAIDRIVKETQSGDVATRTVIEALLRIILIQLWRAQGGPSVSDTSGAGSQRYFTRFTNLIEVHFRDRWTVARYAKVLGISADRLTDICRRVRGRTPRQIISARTGVEARLLLESSLHSIDQIGGLLGFQNAAHFNRFFKSLAGVPPGQYRRNKANLRPISEAEESADLYQWP